MEKISLFWFYLRSCILYQWAKWNCYFFYQFSVLLLLIIMHIAVGLVFFVCLCWREEDLEKEKQASSKQRRHLFLEKKKSQQNKI